MTTRNRQSKPTNAEQRAIWLELKRKAEQGDTLAAIGCLVLCLVERSQSNRKRRNDG